LFHRIVKYAWLIVHCHKKVGGFPAVPWMPQLFYTSAYIVVAMKEVILSLGGSLIVPNEIDVAFLKKFRALILKHVRKGTRFFIITGGGKVCRDYQAAAGKIVPLSQEDTDWIGIHVTRMNAAFVRLLFKDVAFKHILGNPEARIQLGPKDRVIIGAGWKPGWSTDMDAVLLAKTYKVKTVLNLTNVDYAYDKDPRKFKGAKRLECLTWTRFLRIVGGKWKSGMHAPFDPVASRLAAKLGLKVVITNGRDLRNLDRMLSGQRAKGTIVD
jgi:uridylate kinase